MRDNEPNQVNELNLRSEELQDIIVKPPSWIIRWGITIVFFLTILLFIFSFIIKYPDFIEARTTITSEVPPDNIYSRFSGILDEVFVANGENVKSNEVLGVIQNPAITEDVLLLKNIIDSFHVNNQEQIFELNRTTVLILGDVELAYSEFENAYLEYRLNIDLQPRLNELSNGRITKGQVELKLQEKINQQNYVNLELELKRNEYLRYETLFNKGVISEQEYENKKQEFLRLEQRKNEILIEVEGLKENLSKVEYSLNSTVINKKVDDSRLYNNLLQAYNILNLEIKKWERKYLLKSSIDGRVSFNKFWGKNQLLELGDHVFTVMPQSEAKLLGILEVPALNLGKIEVGQKVLVRLDNFPFQEHGVLKGNVTNISFSPDRENKYTVYMNFPNGTISTYGKKLPFNQELQGSAKIVTKDLSVAERIFYKLRKIFSINT